MPDYIPIEKPSADVCPQAYCVHWRSSGGWFAPGCSESLKAAFQHLNPITMSHCGWAAGRCTRLDPISGDQDWYEPHEPQLFQDGLPWFYFFPHPQTVTDEVRDDYIRESERLWGRHHWSTSSDTD